MIAIELLRLQQHVFREVSGKFRILCIQIRANPQNVSRFVPLWKPVRQVTSSAAVWSEKASDEIHNTH